MEYRYILKQAWASVWRYRALWLFGAVLALTTLNGFFFPYDFDPDRGWQGITVTNDNTVYFRGQGITLDFSGKGWPTVIADDWNEDDVREFFALEWWGDLSSEVRAIFIASGVVLGFMILFGLMGRYVSETALIGMLDSSEDTGKKSSLRQGLRMGFSRSAWRLFLIDLLFFVLKLLVFGALLAGALTPLLLWMTKSRAAGVAGIAITAGLLLLWLVLAVAFGAALSLVTQVIRRACVIDGQGVLNSIRKGFLVARSNLKQVTVVWLIWLGIRLAWMLAAVPVLLLVSPLIVPFILAGAVIGGVPAVAVAAALLPVLKNPFPWIVGAIAGGPIFLLVMLTPWLLVGGLVEVLKSCTWTLAYRQLHTLASAEPARTAGSDVSGLEAVPVSR